MNMSNKSTNRLKLFLENFFVYGFSRVFTSLVPMLLLPVITNLLTDPTDYGKFDIYNTILNLGTNIAVLGLYDAMFREFFEDDSIIRRTKVTSSAFGVVLISSTTISALGILFSKSLSLLFFSDSANFPIVIVSFISIFLSAINSIIIAPIRMNNQRRVYTLSSVGNSIFYYVVAIFLVSLGWRYWGLITGSLVSILSLSILYYVMNRKYFSLKKFDLKTAKQLLKIGLPLVPTFIIYWVFSSYAKIVIIHKLGAASEGIYAIGAKLASISQFIYMAFAGGWQYFAFSTMKDDDQISLISNIFEWLAAISFSVFSLANLVYKPVFHLLLSGSYVNGYIVFPFLFLSPLILMLFQILANQVLIAKKSILCTLSLVIGVIVNLLFTPAFTDLLGVKGSAFITLFSYVVSVLAIIAITQRKKMSKIGIKFYILLFIAVSINVVLLFTEGLVINLLSLLLLTLCIVFYIKDIKKILGKIVFKKAS